MRETPNAKCRLLYRSYGRLVTNRSASGMGPGWDVNRAKGVKRKLAAVSQDPEPLCGQLPQV